MPQPQLAIANLGVSFKKYFQIVPALSDALKYEAFRIRHKVYCEDLKFERIQSEGVEIDGYDRHSLHLLIRSVQTNEFIGCTRIIRPQPEDPSCLLPFEKLCRSVLDKSIVDPGQLPRQTIAEVSRLAVVASYRRRKNEKNQSIGLSEQDFPPFSPQLPQPLQSRFPYIPLGLYLGTAELARINGIDTLFVLTEERLACHFIKLDFGLKFIGEAIDHHGCRLPSMMKISDGIRRIKPMLRPLYDAIATDIRRGLTPPPF
jgi:N-acyl amino acid synthase of PEP-CTERM/exosortase system